MLMPQADRKKIYEHFFENGVILAKKDVHLKSHPEIEGVRNLYVIKAMKSLLSRGYVWEEYNWRYYHFSITKDGILYLREYLGLPEDIVPNTWKPKKEMAQQGYLEKPNRGFGKPDTDREGYRTADTEQKVTEAGPGAGAISAGGEWS